MYIYDEIDKQLLNERLAQFSDQMQRYLDGKLADNEFLPLRLQNGLYRQRFALCIASPYPYGMLTSTQLRKIAHIARTYDKGFAHVTTRQNFQLHWTRFEECPKILPSWPKSTCTPSKPRVTSFVTPPPTNTQAFCRKKSPTLAPTLS